jgi:beta-N-acetylhexosaminidase
MGAAMVAGYKDAGIAATAKHFPGKGEAVVDPHDTLPVLDLDDDRLDAVEFAPFRAAAAAGVDLLMIGHYSVPGLTGDRVTPISASPALRDVVRRRIGFGGVVISDALDMGAFTASGTNASLVAAGVDALLCMTDRARAAAACLDIADSDPTDHAAATGRLTALRRRLAARTQPGLDRLRSPGHLAVAAEVATRSLTLVRDGGTLPLARGERILAVMPRPTDLTPADTSSFQAAGLAAALRGEARSVSEMVVSIEPESSDIEAVLAAALDHDAVVLGTIAADVHPGQAALARRLVDAMPRVVTVALRTPFDLAAYPEAATHLCTYSLLEPSMTALAASLFGGSSFPGRLPAPIPGLYSSGHGVTDPRSAP